MKVRDLYAARPLESQQQPAPDYRSRYAEAAQTIREDCFLIDPHWLIDAHPELWEQIRDLDNRLTEMEREAASESEYQAVLMQLMKVVQDARAAYERETRQSSERGVL